MVCKFRKHHCGLSASLQLFPVFVVHSSDIFFIKGFRNYELLAHYFHICPFLGISRAYYYQCTNNQWSCWYHLYQHNHWFFLALPKTLMPQLILHADRRKLDPYMLMIYTFLKLTHPRHEIWDFMM